MNINHDRRIYRQRYCVECERMFWYNIDAGVFYAKLADALEPVVRCDCGVPLTLMRTSSVRPTDTLTLPLF